jgi:hypothetical protein
MNTQPNATEAAKLKIAKLLNMTVANGCTEDEAESALRMAAGIAARAGIELGSIKNTDGTAAQPKKAKAKDLRQEYKPHQTFAAHAAAILFGVECNYYDFGKTGITFVGREENIELVESTWFWIMRQVEELYRTALPKGLDKATRGEFRRTFKEACALRVLERAKVLMRDMKRSDTAAQSATGHNALVVTGHFEQLERENVQFWEDQAAEYEAQRQARLAAMTDEQRAAIEARNEQYRREAEKAAKRRANREYKEPRQRTIRTGVGTRAGINAANQVKLRDEVK